MKLLHLSDLHLGKRVNDFSMIEDQEYILKVILSIAAQEAPDAVIIAGDIYDKSTPSAEAVMLFDGFLNGLTRLGTHIFAIAGNHDSPERIAFGNKLMSASGVHMSPVYDGAVEPVILHDNFGKVGFYMLPFIKPSSVRQFFDGKEISTYTDALKAAIDRMDIDCSRRNVIIAHQFVTGAVLSDSEDISVGGTENVDASVFDCFDYCALGHIHRPQNVGRDNIRYCGTPLKYSFSEIGHKKSITVVDLKEKGRTEIHEIPIIPLRDLREIKGTYAELTAKKNYESTNTSDYIRVVLTDEEDVPEAIGRLRAIYPNIMKLEYDNTRTRSGLTIDVRDATFDRSPFELFSSLYELQNGRKMSAAQEEYSKKLINEVWKEDI